MENTILGEGGGENKIWTLVLNCRRLNCDGCATESKWVFTHYLFEDVLSAPCLRRAVEDHGSDPERRCVDCLQRSIRYLNNKRVQVLK